MSSIATFTGLALIALSLERLTQRSRLPFSIVLVITGFIGSEIITRLGFDTGLTWHNFQHIILQVLVPILVFDSAYKLPLKLLLPNLALVLCLAIPGMLLAAGITGLGLYWGIGHPDYFPLTAALLAGIIASATDPVAVIAIFEKLGAPKRLTTLLEGESLLNDATAVVAYSVIVALLLSPQASFELAQTSSQFATTFGGAIGTGLVIGLGAWLMSTLCHQNTQLTVIAICAGILSFWLAEHLLHVSGIVAVLTTGLVTGAAHRQLHPAHQQTTDTAELSAWLANALVFILVGVSITVDMFSQQWLTMLIAIGAALIARSTLIFAFLPLARGLTLSPKLPLNWLPVLTWGGLRGGVSLALVLSIPTTIESWYVIQAAVYGVVLFSLLVQATSAEPLIKRLLK